MSICYITVIDKGIDNGFSFFVGPGNRLKKTWDDRLSTAKATDCALPNNICSTQKTTT